MDTTSSLLMGLPAGEYVQRRQQLVSQLEPDSVVCVAAARLRYRNRDTEYAFRQDSDFLYLTGFNEPDALLVLRCDADNRLQAMMFVAPRDPEQEIWNGYRAGVKGAIDRYGMDQAYTLDQQQEQLVELLDGCRHIYYPMADERLGRMLQQACQQLQRKHRSADRVPQHWINAEPILHEQRLIKTAAEQQLLRQAGRISAEAHCTAMRNCRPGLFEYQLEADIHHSFGHHGCRFPAYGTIVGGGANGCVLHYTDNGDRLVDGDLVLIDAGCELHGYAGDITRTFPVNGRFSDEQRALYQWVLDAQLAAIEAVIPGAHFDAPHQAALRVLTTGLVELGLLEGEVETLINDEAYKPFYMHRTSHWLGLDVHDVGDSRCAGKPRLLQPGMVLTIEPGLYIAPDNDRVEAKWRGIGIRIEDDLLVTEMGHEVLTDGVPKLIDEIESLMAVNGVVGE